MRLLALMPKWVPVAIVAGFGIYYTGVSHGRAPYKQAAAISAATSKVVTKNFDLKEIQTRKNGEKANEALKNVECFIDDDMANWLSINRSN